MSAAAIKTFDQIVDLINKQNKNKKHDEVDAIRYVVELIKRDLPKLPDSGYIKATQYDPEESWCNCPNCEEPLDTENKVWYCPECGQAIKWPEEDLDE